MKFTTMMFAFLFTFGVFAQDIEGFNKRFKIMRNEDGTTKAIQMRLITKKFSLKPYLNQVKNDVLQEIERLKGVRFTDEELNEFEQVLAEEFESQNGFASNPDAPKITRKAIENLKNVNIKKSFKILSNKGIFNKLKLEISDALMILRLDVIANTEDYRYFFKRKVGYEVVTRVLKFAKKQLGDVPLLNLATFIVLKVNDLIMEQRLFHQNMLMHYLNEFDEKELGLTHEEVNKIFSSIYESRMAIVNTVLEYKKIKAQWNHYGTDRFFQMVRQGNKVIRAMGDKSVQKVSYNFTETNEEGRKIYHLLNKRHMFSQKLALAFDYEKPGKVRRFRSLLNLGQLGLGFLPINGTIKGFVTSFIESFYVQQKRSEGALAAYFESNGNDEMAKAFYRQTINPYIIY